MLLISYSCTKDESRTEENAALSKRAFYKPDGVITPERAKELDANWSNNQAKAIETVLGIQDNRSNWWSLEDMRNYLDYAENQTKELGYTMSGVRIYLAAYGKEEGEKAGQGTLFFVPTGSKIGLRDGDGDIPGGNGMNAAGNGQPPTANYPQN